MSLLPRLTTVPMLDKTNYSSWVSHMLLYVKGKEHGKLLVDSVLNGPFQYGIMVEPGNETTPATIRARTYTDLTDEEKIRESVDIKATHIILQGLPHDIYNLVNHNKDAKQIWDIVKLLIQGLELSLQERESKLYDDFDTFTSMPGETIHSYYMRFVHLINDMHTIGTDIANSQEKRFLNRTKQDTGERLRDKERELHFNSFFVLAPAVQQSSSIELDLGLVIPSFNPSDDPISNLNKLMAFVTTSFGPRFPQTNNQLRTLSNPRNQATIQDGRVIQRHFARQCTKPKRPKNSAWFKEKMLMTEVLELEAYLDLEQLAFLADNGDTIVPAQAYQEIPTPAAFQTDDLDAFDFDCDDIHSLKLQLKATVESHKTLSTTVECLKKESKQKEDKYLDEVIDLQKKNKALDNVVYKIARRKVPALYDANTIVKTHVALSVTDSEETLELDEKSRLKMLAKQNDPSLKEKKVNIAPVDYVALNKLSENFVTHFVP
ncbi:hypothetical protein Tco_1310574 [Tanacetum coccineum]